MELRAEPTSLRRTHEVEPVSGEPNETAPEETPVVEAEETSSGPVPAESRQSESEASTPAKAARAALAQGRGRKKKGKGKGEDQEESTVALEPLRPEDDEPVKGAYHVALPTFEGPLDLLLHLIQQHELDIKDIPIAFVSEKYVEYIMLMQDLNIDLASEYLVMAATLAHIKSKMLLPKPPVDQDDDAVEELDPRGELVRRLLEYQKYKHAAEKLGSSPVLGRDVFVRGAPAPSIDGPSPLAQVSVFKLFDAFQRLLSRAKQGAEHLIDVDRISISERIIQLTDLLRGRGPVPFSELFDEDTTRPDLIVSFLAVLEMTRLRMMVVFQDGPLAPIHIELTITDEHDEILKQTFDHGDDPLASLARGDVEHLAESLKEKPAGAEPGTVERSVEAEQADLDAIEASFPERVSFEEMMSPHGTSDDAAHSDDADENEELSFEDENRD